MRISLLRSVLFPLLLAAACGAAQAPIAQTEVALSDTPAARQFKAWLAAFNSGDRAMYQQFLQNEFPSRASALDRDMTIRDISGGFDLRKLEQGSAVQIIGLMQERDSDQFGRFALEVEPTEPHRVLTLSIQAVPRPVEFPIAPLTQIDAIASVKAEKNAAADRFAGTFLVAKNGKIIFSGAYGLADREKRIPKKLDTRFRIGSMNKMFTAVAVLQLVEAGKIQLTDTVGKYVVDYPDHDVASKVTIHQLLTHTGGTGDIFGGEFDTHRLELRTLDDYVALYGKRSLRFEPGSRWEYSNYGFLLLGVVILSTRIARHA
jgi:D-alanyl-D-alanine carboxypeptidase